MKVLQLGQERVMRAKKAYVTLYVTPLLIEALFGEKYSLVPREAIVYQSKHMIVMHFFLWSVSTKSYNFQVIALALFERMTRHFS